MRFACLVCLSLLGPQFGLAGDTQVALDDKLHHLRVAGPREWTEFPQQPESDHLQIAFDAEANATPQTLRLRQQDVKQTWRVQMNGKELGRLRVDENDMVVYFPVAAGTLRQGENVLRIEQDVRRRMTPDDVRIGEVLLDRRPMTAVLEEAAVEVAVTDEQTGRPLPARITIVNDAGALQTPGAESNDHLAVRPGIVYTASGQASFGLPAGDYTIFAGRGFEYSLARQDISLSTGQAARLALALRREVPTGGYVACDTHVHTLTHSGHGDASVEERMITLAAEGIELPIATDHNAHVDHEPFAQRMNVRRYFTPVIGNEVTTRTGHFNIFPVQAGSAIPDFKSDDWQVTLDGIFATSGVKVAILNHARDLHGGTRPFGPQLFNAVVGENLEDWPMRFNAMETINSGATQTDPLRLFHDWMALLNRGRQVTPVGSSDSHDVGRHFVGQGRTYIRCDDRDPGHIDVEQAVNNFLQGRVLVSYGLLTELVVNGKYRAGELAVAPPETYVEVSVRVLGPHWTSADRVQLFANGLLVDDLTIDGADRAKNGPGVIWADQWKIDKPKHDVHLVAIATGPGIDGLYWKTAKPYQPASPDWTPRVVGCSGAVWLDVDGDGRRTSAYDYARGEFNDARNDLRRLAFRLGRYDAAVAAQAAHLLETNGKSLSSPEVFRPLENTPGIRAYMEAHRRSVEARAEP